MRRPERPDRKWAVDSSVYNMYIINMCTHNSAYNKCYGGGEYTRVRACPCSIYYIIPTLYYVLELHCLAQAFRFQRYGRFYWYNRHIFIPVVIYTYYQKCITRVFRAQDLNYLSSLLYNSCIGNLIWIIKMFKI